MNYYQPGKVYCQCDYSAIEIRIWAAICAKYPHLKVVK